MYWIAAIIALPYSLMLMAIWKNLRLLKQYEIQSAEILFISIIIPVKNEKTDLPFLLNDLTKQDYPPDSFEVIIIDDNSEDETFNIASDYKGIRNLSIVRSAGTGKKSAIRTGVEHSSGGYIITTDADCRMKKGWLMTICSFLIQNKPDLLICPVSLENRKGFFGRFQELEFLSLQGITTGSALSGNPVMCNGANLAFKKEAYLRNIDFMHNEILSGDDVFLLHSLKKEDGAKIMWLESVEATVIASSSENLIMFLKQRKRWLSKGKAYTDRDTLILSIVTFVTNLIIILLTGAGFFNPGFLIITAVVFIMKSVPDFLILSETAKRYGRKELIKWFLPSAVIYPFYVLLIAVITFSSRSKINFPSRKGILPSSA